MGYNKVNYVRIRAEFNQKYLLAQEEAENRKFLLQTEIPELWELDREIARAGSEIMGAVFAAETPEEKERMVEAAKEKNQALQKRRAMLLMSNGYTADYTDVKYECDLCGDTGFVGTKMCVCMKKALILAGYESSGIANLLREQTFDSFSPERCSQNPVTRQKMQNNLATLRTFAENFSDKKSENFLLIGGTGRGKTGKCPRAYKKPF